MRRIANKSTTIPGTLPGWSGIQLGPRLLVAHRSGLPPATGSRRVTAATVDTRPQGADRVVVVLPPTTVVAACDMAAH